MKENNQVLCRLAAVCIAFLLNHSAYYGVEALQSSLNGPIGTYALSAGYVVGTVTSFFLPTLILSFTKKSYAISTSMVPYALYTIANFYPRTYTLIPTMTLIGCGANVVWTGSRIYVTDLSQSYATITGRKVDHISSQFFGIFYGFVAAAFVFGSSISSAVLQVFDRKPMASEMILKRQELFFSNCGIYKCTNNHSENAYQEKIATQINATAFNLLFVGFVAVQVIAAITMFFKVVDDVPHCNSHHEGTALVREKEDHCVEGRQKMEQSTIEQIIDHGSAIARFLIFNHNAKLLIPISLQGGLLQAFVLSQFTRDWITCNIGIENVGYAVGAYGVGAVLGSCGIGVISNTLPRWVIVLIDLLAEIATCVILLTWEPIENEDTWLYFTIIGALGVISNSRKSIITTTYSLYFPSDKAAALASFETWDCLGKGIAFAVSSDICNWNYIILLISLTSLGTLLYLIAENSYRKSQK